MNRVKLPMSGFEAMDIGNDDVEQFSDGEENQDDECQADTRELISDQILLKIQRGIFGECISSMDKQKAHMWPANNIYNIVEYKQSTDDNSLMQHLIDELARQIESGKWDPKSVKHAFTILFIFNTVDEEVCKNLNQVRSIIGSSCMVDFHQTTAVFESQEIVHDIEYKKMFFVMEEALKLVNIKKGVRNYESLESYKNKKLIARYEEIINFDVGASFSDWLFKQACLEFVILPNLLTKVDTCLTGLSCMAHFKSINLEIATDEKIHGCFFASVYNHVKFCLKRQTQSKNIQPLKDIVISICEMFRGVEFAKQCFYLMEMNLEGDSYNIANLSKTCHDLIEHTFPLMYKADRVTMPQDGINEDYQVVHEVVDLEDEPDECVPITPYLPMSPIDLLPLDEQSTSASSGKMGSKTIKTSGQGKAKTLKSQLPSKNQKPFKNKKEQEECISGLVEDYKIRYMSSSSENTRTLKRSAEGKPATSKTSSTTKINSTTSKANSTTSKASSSNSKSGPRVLDKNEPPTKRSKKGNEDDKSIKVSSSKANGLHEISDSEDEIDFCPRQSTKTIVEQIKQGGRVMKKIKVVKD